MPTLSDAFAVILITPETVAPSAGDVIDVVGGITSAVGGEPNGNSKVYDSELPELSAAITLIVTFGALAMDGKLIVYAVGPPDTAAGLKFTPSVE